jgi:hypothetical protein
VTSRPLVNMLAKFSTAHCTREENVNRLAGRTMTAA